MSPPRQHKKKHLLLNAYVREDRIVQDSLDKFYSLIDIIDKK